jgi:hypothetical protein
MPRSLLMLVAFVSLAATAAAQDGPKFSVGYAYLHHYEGLGNAPVGAFVSLAGGGATTLEVDAGYHRDSEDPFTLETFTLTAGPRFGFGQPGNSAPFMHILGGARRDKVEDQSNTSFGGMAGLGIDIRTSSRISLRLGADFQMFFDHGDNVKSLRLGVGLTF